jgi:hypothetical protein
MSAFHLAQLNIGRMVAPIDAPEVADFVSDVDDRWTCPAP